MVVLSEYVFFISSYFIFLEPFWLKNSKKGLIEKKIAIWEVPHFVPFHSRVLIQLLNHMIQK